MLIFQELILIIIHNIFASFQFSINYNIAILILFCIILILFTIYIYRITIPQIPKWKKIFLIILRSLSIFLIGLLLFEPLLTLIYRTEEKPILCVLVDNSKSMSLTDKIGDRTQLVKRVINSDIFNAVKNIGDVKFATFSDKVKFSNTISSDSLNFTGNITDISKAIKETKSYFSDRNLQNLIIITDGQYNLGQNPIYQAETFNKPINIIAIGDSSEQKDLSINRVITNNIVYKDSKVPVDVWIKSSGFKNESIDVNLYDEAKLLENKKITLKEGTAEYPVEFTFEPGEEGVKKLSVTVSKFSDEITDKNNKKTFFVKVLKNKIKTLIIAGTPSSDVSFVKNANIQDKNVDVKSFVQKQNGSFYEGNFQKSSLDSIECIFFIGFPTASTRQDVMDILKSFIEEKNVAIFFILGNDLDYQKLKYFEPFLPFSVSQVNNNEILAGVFIPQNQSRNPIIKITGTDADPSLWNKLPPIFRTETVFKLKQESDLIATIQINNITFASPLLVSRKMYKQKSLAILGYGIWRWKLLAEGLDDNENLFQTFFGNSLRWLTTREEDSRLKISLSKEIYNTGEKVEVYAQLYNENYEPLDNGNITVQIAKDEKYYEINLSPVGIGRYMGSIEDLEEGDYHYIAKAEYYNKIIGESKGRFSIGELNLEYQNIQMNAPLLKQITFKTNGKFYTINDYETFINDLKNDKNFTIKEVIHRSEIQIWNLCYILMIVILFLAIEWFIRKKSGML